MNKGYDCRLVYLTFDGQTASSRYLYLHLRCLHVNLSRISSTCLSRLGVLHDPLVCIGSMWTLELQRKIRRTLISTPLSIQSGRMELYRSVADITKGFSRPYCLGNTYFAKCLACSICSRASGITTSRVVFDNQDGYMRLSTSAYHLWVQQGT